MSPKRNTPPAVPATPQATYQAEKAKAGRERARAHDEAMADAKRAFDQLMEDGRAARKGGRPKKVKPTEDVVDEIEE
jgi:hypothetical protein